MRQAIHTVLWAALWTISCVVPYVHGWGETADQVAHRARSLLLDPSHFGVAILSTVYAADHADPALRGAVSSGPEYFAACHDNGDLTMLAMPVSQNWRNALFAPGRNATLSIGSSANPAVPDPRHTDSKGDRWDPERPAWRRGMPSKQRLTLYGHFDRIENRDEAQRIAACYTTSHPDARHWTPGSEESPHEAFWARFVVDRVYRVGGFGDESSIGWVNMDLWHRSGKGLLSDQQQTSKAGPVRDTKIDHQRLFGEANHLSDEVISPSLHFQQ